MSTDVSTVATAQSPQVHRDANGTTGAAVGSTTPGPAPGQGIRIPHSACAGSLHPVSIRIGSSPVAPPSVLSPVQTPPPHVSVGHAGGTRSTNTRSPVGTPVSPLVISPPQAAPLLGDKATSHSGSGSMSTSFGQAHVYNTGAGRPGSNTPNNGTPTMANSPSGFPVMGASPSHPHGSSASQHYTHPSPVLNGGGGGPAVLYPSSTVNHSPQLQRSGSNNQLLPQTYHSSGGGHNGSFSTSPFLPSSMAMTGSRGGPGGSSHGGDPVASQLFNTSFGDKEDDGDSVFSGTSSNASSIREDLPLCPEDLTCTLLNERAHQRRFAHTCRLNPCYHGNVRYHSRLFRHSPGQVVTVGGDDSMSGRSTPDVGATKAGGTTRNRRRTKKALTSVTYSSISPDAPNATKITVVCNDLAYEICGDWKNVKIHTLKRYLQQVLSIPPAAQRLILNFTQVIDDDLASAAEVGIEEQCTLAVQILSNAVPMEMMTEKLEQAIIRQQHHEQQQQPQQAPYAAAGRDRDPNPAALSGSLLRGATSSTTSTSMPHQPRTPVVGGNLAAPATAMHSITGGTNMPSNSSTQSFGLTPPSSNTSSTTRTPEKPPEPPVGVSRKPAVDEL
jgi:hypothetical protein